ncbi:hypothetical protein QYE76_028964 [Lolium multiflorum]|uniref:Uncharacterized protein n=1 Tax=Lolium multiflorum TaxID=4521 RepID=A0AAD8QNA4_LOLMU|nr:hypothetical protein QYE76_028964 [Lolium multiflorum]
MVHQQPRRDFNFVGHGNFSCSERLLEILKKHRGAIGYTLDDLKGISPSICQHAINMEDDAKPVVEHHRRLIPKMKDVKVTLIYLLLLIMLLNGWKPYPQKVLMVRPL